MKRVGAVGFVSLVLKFGDETLIRLDPVTRIKEPGRSGGCPCEIQGSDQVTLDVGLFDRM